MTEPDFEHALAEFVGRPLRARAPAQDPVNLPMIRHWVEAMGDDNPIYLDEAAAHKSGRTGVVAPATMVQAWTMRGYKAHQRRTSGKEGADADTAEVRLLALLESAGYTAVVATDSEYEFMREVVPGDHLSVGEELESVSAEKKTALGVGRFLQTVRTYTDDNGDVVAQQRFRTLRFRPVETAPPASPRPRPALNADNQFWFDAANDQRLLVQRCLRCGVLRHPPGPCCPHCQAFDWDTVEASGRGSIYSFTIAHHPPHPAFDYPLILAVVELEEGTRLIANVVDTEREHVRVDAPVVVEWIQAGENLSLPAFRVINEGRH